MAKSVKSQPVTTTGLYFCFLTILQLKSYFGRTSLDFTHPTMFKALKEIQKFVTATDTYNYYLIICDVPFIIVVVSAKG